MLNCISLLGCKWLDEHRLFHFLLCKCCACIRINVEVGVSPSRQRIFTGFTWKTLILAHFFFIEKGHAVMQSLLGLPYVLFLEDMSSFSTKKQLSSEDAKKCINVPLFGIINSDNIPNNTSTKNFGKFQDELYGLRAWWPSSFFGRHLILGGKLDICGIGASRGGHGAMAPPLWLCNKVLKRNFQSIISQTNNGCSLVSLILAKLLLLHI